ncbi:MAG TPA: ribonuclease HII [Gemmatimonadales bacterium]
MDGPTLERERALWAAGVHHVAGVDEVGRGPVAGPVVAAAVIFAPGQDIIEGLRDSKRMTAAERERAAVLVRDQALAWGVGAASVHEIDRVNILRASVRAMRRALDRARIPVDRVLLDGNALYDLDRPHDAIVGGDNISLSIAAASVLAKVVRDRLMIALGRRYPAFKWERNKGYATAAHLAAIDEIGPTPHHRTSFTPVSQLSLFVPAVHRGERP